MNCLKQDNCVYQYILDLFDAIVAPVLLYGAEVCGKKKIILLYLCIYKRENVRYAEQNVF